MKRLAVDSEETFNQAIRYVRSNPCCICSYEDSRTHECRVGVKYKSTDAIAEEMTEEFGSSGR